jgi:hypothetical protein
VSFATAIGNDKKCIYTIDAEGQSYYEIGIGTVVTGSPNTLQRTTVLKSSNSNNAFDLPAGTKRVYIAPETDLFVLRREISPTQITADQNDYAPTGNAGATVWRLNTNASRSITGIANGAKGRVIKLFNVGSTPIVLPSESASSTAANRFSFCSASISLLAGDSAEIWYDETSSRWRCSASCVTQITFLAHKNGTDQTGVASATDTKVTFGTEDSDVWVLLCHQHILADCGRQVSPVCRYLVRRHRRGGQEVISVKIYKNGAEHRSAFQRRSGAQSCQAIISVIVDNDGNATFEVCAAKSGAGSGSGLATHTWFCGELM